MKLRHQRVALTVLAALMSQMAQATTSDNVAGRISGRQIVMMGIPTLVGDGYSGTTLSANVPATSDLDGDQLSDWRYQWKVDGVAVSAEAAAGSTTVIPNYGVQNADVGKSIALCLKAVADKGYPVATQQSAEGCSTPLVVPASTLDITAPGAQSVLENSPYQLMLAATGSNPSPTYIWALDGGADMASFAIDAGTGQLSMVPQNFEAPLDAGVDNNYEVTVKVTDSVTGVSSTEAISVAVIDVGEALTASAIADMDNAVADAQSSNAVTLLLVNDSGNPAVGQAVNITTDKGTLSAATGISDGNGKVNITLTHNLAEMATVTFSWTGPDGVAAMQTQSVTFTTGNVSTVNVVDAGGAALPNPVIQGQVLHSQTLLQGESSAQNDRIGLTYEWQKQDRRSGEAENVNNWVTIAGATGPTYTTTAADQGYQFRVIATKP